MATIETQLLENVREFTAFARKRLRDPELAADVVQESLLKALRSSDQLRDKEPPKPGSTASSAERLSTVTGAVTCGTAPEKI